jgi:hypothetical protein
MEYVTLGTQNYAFKGRGALNRLEPVRQEAGQKVEFSIADQHCF